MTPDKHVKSKTVLNNLSTQNNRGNSTRQHVFVIQQLFIEDIPCARCLGDNDERTRQGPGCLHAARDWWGNGPASNKHNYDMHGKFV